MRSCCSFPLYAQDSTCFPSSADNIDTISSFTTGRFPLVSRAYAVAFTNATAFIALGGRQNDGTQSQYSVGYDVSE